MVHSEARTRLDNLTKTQSSNAWISSWNAQMLHFPLCRESVLGMPRIEIELEFDMVFCFGIRLAPCAVFSTRIYLLHIARPVESDRSLNILFVRPFFRSQFMNVSGQRLWSVIPGYPQYVQQIHVKNLWGFMSTQAGLSLLWIYLSFCRFCCAPAHLQLWCTTL